ncbi:PREDICTED: serine protease inhibitor Kazal-type 14 [Miniopterus natalensis]|uniref:serine protease inhibitor Kazal-type 14 n=1 Tax=Miniopterus natalensis TaxID=291302 RepID=UPI0007A6C3BC|nr:PREDICTED: serine protease inhibitor Kazal-type 14 [Miniopterus natalensis]
MAKSFPILHSMLFFMLIHWVYVLVSGPQRWWPARGGFKVKCPVKKVDLSWFKGTLNPCSGIYEPICGTNLVTYENPCILCIENLKSSGKITYLRDGPC